MALTLYINCSTDSSKAHYEMCTALPQIILHTCYVHGTLAFDTKIYCCLQSEDEIYKDLNTNAENENSFIMHILGHVERTKRIHTSEIRLD